METGPTARACERVCARVRTERHTAETERASESEREREREAEREGGMTRHKCAHARTHARTRTRSFTCSTAVDVAQDLLLQGARRAPHRHPQGPECHGYCRGRLAPPGTHSVFLSRTHTRLSGRGGRATGSCGRICTCKLVTQGGGTERENRWRLRICLCTAMATEVIWVRIRVRSGGKTGRDLGVRHVCDTHTRTGR
jgi:hypothetical protein